MTVTPDARQRPSATAATPDVTTRQVAGGIEVTITQTLSARDIAALLFTAPGYRPIDIARPADAQALLASILTGTDLGYARSEFASASTDERPWELACLMAASALTAGAPSAADMHAALWKLDELLPPLPGAEVRYLRPVVPAS